jgi:hypothetical protein
MLPGKRWRLGGGAHRWWWMFQRATGKEAVWEGFGLVLHDKECIRSMLLHENGGNAPVERQLTEESRWSPA